METTINPNSVGHGWSRAVRVGAVVQLILIWQERFDWSLVRLAFSTIQGGNLSHQEMYFVLFVLALPLIVLLPFALATSVIAPHFAGIVTLAFSVGSVLWMAHNGVLVLFIATHGELYGAGLMSALLVYLLSAGLCAAQCRHVPRESRPFWLFLPPMVLALLGWLNFTIGILFMPPTANPWFPIALAGCLASVVILIAWLGWWRAYNKARKAAP